MLQQRFVLALDDFESTDAAADVHSHPFVVFGGHLQAGTDNGEVRRRDGELDESPHLLDVLLLDILKRIETLDFSGDAAGKLGGVKSGNRADAALPASHGLPGVLGPNPNGRHQADTCYHYSARQVILQDLCRKLLLGRTAFDVVDGIFDGGDFFRVFVGDFNLKSFFEGHY